MAGVHHRDGVGHELGLGVRRDRLRPARTAIAAGIDGDDPEPAGEIRYLGLSRAGVDDRVNGREHHRRLALAEHLVTDLDADAINETLAAARHVRRALAPDGTWLIVEPYAGDTITGNLNPIGRIYYCGSTLLCVPNAMSQTGGYALGARAGQAAIRQLVTDAGFTRFRRAAETPFNIVYEARP